MYRRILAIAGLFLCIALPKAANAASISVGYADNLRPSPFFPSPWAGDVPAADFHGGGTSFDAGAILIDNSGGSSDITLNSLVVDIFDQSHGDHSFNLWGAITIAAGHKGIFTQTASYNFDTSDFGNTPSDPVTYAPEIHLNFTDGTTQTYDDTARVLNTGGYDLASYPPGSNESLNWRPIGTTGVENPGGGAPVPEPAFFQMGGLLGMGCLGYIRRRKVMA